MTSRQILGSQSRRVRTYTEADLLEELKREEEEAEKFRAEQQKIKQDEQKQKAVYLASKISGIGIIDMGDFWRITKVIYKSGSHNVDLAKSLLDNGVKRNQNSWASYSENAMENGEFHTPGYPLFYSVIRAVYLADQELSTQKDPIKEMQARELTNIRNFLRASFRANKLLTLTKILYSRDGVDTIIHNYGTREIYNESGRFTGPTGILSGVPELSDGPMSDSMRLLLGTYCGPAEVSRVFKWLNRTDTYFSRLSSKPKKSEIKAASFSADSYAKLDCLTSLDDAYSSLGVRLANFGGIDIK